jgi:hypothetical protein
MTGTVRRWPLVQIGAPAAVAIWSGWVGLGEMCGERLGHASATITLSMYAHVMPSNQRDAAEVFASWSRGEMHDEQAGNIRGHHGPLPADRVPLSPVRMWCPRGESPLTYIPTIIGELVLGGHQHTS